MAEELISISAAARQIGVNKSTLARQLKGSSVPFHEGKVFLSDVLAFRASAIDLTRSGRREGRLDDVGDAPADATVGAADATAPDVDAKLGERPETVIVDGQALPYAEARALKETYLARLRKHEYEVAQREWVRVEEVGRIVEYEYGTLRSAVLSLSAKLADKCVGHDRLTIKLIIDQAADDLLSNLSAPYDMAEKAQQ